MADKELFARGRVVWRSEKREIPDEPEHSLPNGVVYQYECDVLDSLESGKALRDKMLVPQGVQTGQVCRFKFSEPETERGIGGGLDISPLKDPDGGACWHHVDDKPSDSWPGMQEPPPAIPTVFQDFGKEPTAKPALAGLTREWPMPGTAGASLASARMQEGWGE